MNRQFLITNIIPFKPNLSASNDLIAELEDHSLDLNDPRTDRDLASLNESINSIVADIDIKDNGSHSNVMQRVEELNRDIGRAIHKTHPA